MAAVSSHLTDTGKELGRLQGHQAPVTSLAFSPNGDYLASGSADTTALLWKWPPDLGKIGR